MTELQSGPLKCILDEGAGSFSVYDGRFSAPVFEGAFAAVYMKAQKQWLRTTEAAVSTVSAGDGCAEFSCIYFESRYSLRLIIERIHGNEGFSFRIKLTNSGGEEISGVDYYPLVLEKVKGGSLFGNEGNRDFRFLRNGLLTWSQTGLMKPEYSMKKSPLQFVFDACENTEVLPPEGKGNFSGEWFAAIREEKTGRILVAGFASNNEQLGQVTFKSSEGWFRHLKAVSRGENSPVLPGETGCSEKFIIITGGPEEAGPLGFDLPLQQFASVSASECPPPDMPENPVGWCSWYYYFHDMSEKVILQNIEAAKDLRDRIPINLIQIDDGYQPAPGDWLETTSKFPHGMKWLAEKIKDAGFKPGIWMSPFQATHRSELFKTHMDWFVKKAGGDPRFITFWTSPFAAGLIYGLDTTHPEVLKWLKETIHTVVHDWGYEYLKLDFLYAAATDGVRYDNKATRAQAFRRGLEAVREAAGDETFILGCGVPLNLGRGLMNGARISGDTAPYWHNYLQSNLIGHPSAPGVPNAARVLFSRYFMHRNFFMSDPDCLMARFNKTKLGGDEVLTHAACVALAGGPLFLSDNLAEYTSDSIRLAQQLIPPVDTPAVPADLFQSSIPATLVMPFRKDFYEVTIVGRFNWGRHAHDLDVHFEDIGLDRETRYHVYDLWEDRYYGIHTGMVTLPGVPAHASRMLSIRAASKTPHVIATTFHFTQGGIDIKTHEYDPEKKILTIRLMVPGLRKGRVYFYFPEGFNPRYVHVNGPNETVVNREHGRFFSLEFEMNGSATLDIKF